MDLSVINLKEDKVGEGCKVFQVVKIKRETFRSVKEPETRWDTPDTERDKNGHRGEDLEGIS